MRQRLYIVLAEDNRSDVFLVRHALANSGLEYDLHVIEDSHGAASLLERVSLGEPCPDLLLMDLNLPRTDGAELIRMFRAHPHCKNVPVIVITSSDSPKDRARTAALGVDGYFRKPTELSEFMQLGDLVSTVIHHPIR
jgi:CheY-like chemotaxis protein